MISSTPKNSKHDKARKFVIRTPRTPITPKIQAQKMVFGELNIVDRSNRSNKSLSQKYEIELYGPKAEQLKFSRMQTERKKPGN